MRSLESCGADRSGLSKLLLIPLFLNFKRVVQIWNIFVKCQLWFERYCTCARVLCIAISNILFCFQAVAAEKAHISLINGVEHFDKTLMRHAETEEKNALPPIEGILLGLGQKIVHGYVIAIFHLNSYIYLLFFSQQFNRKSRKSN